MAAGIEMHGRGRRQRDLWRDARNLAQEQELIEREFAHTAQLRRRKGRGETRFASALVTKAVGGLADRKAFGAFDKARPIGGTAKLTVGNDGEPNLLLQAHRGANAVVLNFAEFGRIDDAARERLERLTQGRRAEQTADRVGAERWAVRHVPAARRSWNSIAL